MAKSRHKRNNTSSIKPPGLHTPEIQPNNTHREIDDAGETRKAITAIETGWQTFSPYVSEDDLFDLANRLYTLSTCVAKNQAVIGHSANLLTIDSSPFFKWVALVHDAAEPMPGDARYSDLSRLHSLRSAWPEASAVLATLRFAAVRLEPKADGPVVQGTNHESIRHEELEIKGPNASKVSRRGRKPDTNPYADRRLYDDWIAAKASGTRTIAQFADGIGRKSDEVKAAIHRVEVRDSKITSQMKSNY